MKKLIKILLREALDEARSVKGNISKDENIGELLTHIYNKYGFSDTYVSFRDTQHVGKINPNNRFNTPTGLYTYNLADFIDKPTHDLGTFKAKFPFASDRPHFQFLITRSDLNLIESTNSKNQLDVYVKEIQSKFSNIDPVNGLCDKWFSEAYQSYYSEAKHPAHKFWLFIYDVVPYIYPNGQVKNAFGMVCRALGIDGFHDDQCEGWIHPNEQCQTVFFRANVFQDEFWINATETGNSTDMQGNNNKFSFRQPVESYNIPKRGKVKDSDNIVIKLLSQNKIDFNKDIDKLVPYLANPKIYDIIKNIILTMDLQDIEEMLEKFDISELYGLVLLNKEYISRLGDDELMPFLTRIKEPERLVNMLSDEKKELVQDKVKNINNFSFWWMMIKSKNAKALLKLFGDNGIKKVSELDLYELEVELGESDPAFEFIDDVYNFLLVNKDFISLEGEGNISRILKYFGEKSRKNMSEYDPKNNEELINYILSDKNTVANLSSPIISALLTYSLEPKKVLQTLGSKRVNEYVRSVDLDYLINLLPNPEKVLQALGPRGESIMKALSPDEVDDLLEYAEDKKKTIQILRKYGHKV